MTQKITLKTEAIKLIYDKINQLMLSQESLENVVKYISTLTTIEDHEDILNIIRGNHAIAVKMNGDVVLTNNEFAVSAAKSFIADWHNEIYEMQHHILSLCKVGLCDSIVENMQRLDNIIHKLISAKVITKAKKMDFVRYSISTSLREMGKLDMIPEHRQMDEFPVCDITDGYDAGWISPEGKFYGGDGYEKLIHINIADRLQKDGIITVDKGVNPDTWMEMHGWMKIHHDYCFIELRQKKNDTSSTKPFIPTKAQIDALTSYANACTKGIIYTSWNNKKNGKPLYIGKLMQMDQFMMNNAFLCS